MKNEPWVTLDEITQQLATRVQTLETRYAKTPPSIVECVGKLEKKVNGHLEKMGLAV